MATVNNMRGTSYASFGIGKRGITIHQGTTSPDNALGSIGDLYIEHGTSQKLYIRKSSSWIEFSVSSNSISFFENLVPENGAFIGTNSTGLELRSLQDTKASLNLGTAADANLGTSPGNVPVLNANGKLEANTIPSIAITNVFVVEDEAARDALTVETGDIAILQTGESFIYNGTQWLALGHAGGVQAIQTTTTPKTGIVSLEAQDILSGIFAVARGGTGFATYSTGDLLVGGTDTLTKLSLGATGKVLISNGTTVTWGDVVAEKVSFTAGTSSKLTSTNVQAAITELESMSPSVTSKTTNPTQSDDSSKNFKTGDFWYNETTKELFVTNDVTVDNAVWKRLSGEIALGDVKFVAKTGNNTTNDGSLNRPYSSIQTAIDNLLLGGTVFVFPGVYQEDVSVSHSVEIVSTDAAIDGKLSLTGSGIKAKIHLTNSSTAPLVINGASDVKVDGNIIVPNGDAVTISGNTGRIDISKSNISGNVRVQSSSQNPIILTSCENFTLIQTSGNVVVRDSVQINNVQHAGGNLSISNVQKIIASDGKSVVSTSTSNTDFIKIANVFTKQSDGSYGTVEIVDAKFSISNVDFSTSSLTEANRIYETSARDIKASITPVNYTPENVSVASHLVAIDGKLATISTGATTFNELTDVEPYVLGNSNHILKVNETGTGITYGGILGTASTYNAIDFATSMQGLRADSAVQPSQLSDVATTGNNKLTKLSDFPASYETMASKVLRVKSDETGIEFAPALSTVAFSGDYDDLTDKPIFGTAAFKDVGTLSGNIPVLNSSGKLENSVLPDLAITSVSVVADIAERDTLTVQSGDVAIVSSNNVSYIYNGTEWVTLQASNGVLTVNGETGAVTINGQNLSTNHTATNYSSINEFMTSHFAGIDVKLGSLNTDISGLDSRLDTIEPIVASNNSDISTIKTNIQDINTSIADTISKNIFDAAGDILIGTANNTPGILAKGTAGQVLSSTASGLQWIDPSFSSVSNLDSLTDVVITTPSNGQILSFNGTNWVNSAAPSSGEINTLSNTGSSAGVSLVQTTSKVGVDLRVRNIINGSNKISVTSNDTNQTVVIDAVPSNFVITDLSGTLSVAKGGTGLVSFVAGDILYASAANTLSALNKGTDGQVLTLASGIPSWSTLSVSGDSIVTGTTSVKTNEVTNTITVNSRGNRIANFYSDVTVADSEQLKVTASTGKVSISTANASISGDVNLEFAPQGNGVVSFATSGTPILTSTSGTPISVKPGSTSSADGALVTISGGDSTFSTGAGGSVLLKPGTSGATGAAGQVLLPSGYTPSNVNSLVPKSYIDSLRIDQLQAPTATLNFGNQLLSNVASPTSGTDAANRNYVIDRVGYMATAIITTGSSYASTATNHVVLISKSAGSATSVTLPNTTSLAVGKVIIVKDAKGDAATNIITITGNNSETIDGQSSYVLNQNYGSVMVIWNGTEWNIL